jgi:hypothetical protein
MSMAAKEAGMSEEKNRRCDADTFFREECGFSEEFMAECEDQYKDAKIEGLQQALTASQAQAKRMAGALEHSLKLQENYATLLNMYDGGERIIFKSVDEWVDRLKELGEIK